MTEKDKQINLEENPFAALFPSMAHAVQFVSQVGETIKSGHENIQLTNKQDCDDDEETLIVKRIVNNLLQRIFLITLQERKFLMSQQYSRSFIACQKLNYSH